MIDFVIPCHPKDFPSLELSIGGIVNNISLCNRVFVISKEDPNIEGVIHVPEEKYLTFTTKEKIENIWLNKNSQLCYRSKWIYQQFLKLLSARVIQELTDSFVIVDSDTIFLKDISFDSNKFYYCKAEEYHKPYLHPIKTLFGVENTIGFSTICHHMIFNKQKLNEMISIIEKKFDNKLFSDIVLEIIDYNESSCFSEWDLYSNYMLLNYSEMCEQRQLTWKSIPFVPDQIHLEEFKSKYDFISCHTYDRGIQ
jgi:beta-galactosidase beta subunit